MHHLRFAMMAVVGASFCAPALAQSKLPRISGPLQQWHRMTITFTGPLCSEDGKDNPFRDHRLNVTFRHKKSGTSIVVPGFFAADGNAAETGATKGDQWCVHFTPDRTGEWTFAGALRKGPNVAVSTDANAGKPVAIKAGGSFIVAPSDKKGRDHRAQGILRYVGGHYLQYAGSKRYFLKGGADSPENFLGYADFDDTKPRHRYRPHLKDWKPGDPTWKNGKGKGIIGALNYLASKGMNSVYFLTMNVTGDGKDVWPWTNPKARQQFDCSKLDQWEIVFSHMDELGIMLHVILQEQENDQLLNKGALGLERKLYFRELIARFAHHPALTWNLGEENTNTLKQRKEFAKYIRDLDPYDHPVVVHTFPGRYDAVYNPLLGFPYFEGPSLQTNNTHRETLKWRERSAKAGRKWIVCLDEIGPANTGVKPDAVDFAHDNERKKHLWGNLMAGGAGVEWYFGYKYAHNDLNCEDWRSRDHLWELTKHSLDFFQQHLPFPEMQPDDDLTTSKNDYCFAKPGEVYAIYLPNGGSTKLNLAKGNYQVKWYDPRKGGKLQDGSITTLRGPGMISIGNAPSDAGNDWAVLVRLRK